MLKRSLGKTRFSLSYHNLILRKIALLVVPNNVYHMAKTRSILKLMIFTYFETKSTSCIVTKISASQVMSTLVCSYPLESNTLKFFLIMTPYLKQVLKYILEI